MESAARSKASGREGCGTSRGEERGFELFFYQGKKKKKFNLRFSHPEGVRRWELRETGRAVTSHSHPGMQILPDPGLAPGSRVFGAHGRGRTSLLGLRKR